MIILNGNKTNGFEKLSVLELVRKNGYRTERIAVEYNGSILPKSEYKTTVIKENDVIEVVSFVGGG